MFMSLLLLLLLLRSENISKKLFTNVCLFIVFIKNYSSPLFFIFFFFSVIHSVFIRRVHKFYKHVANIRCGLTDTQHCTVYIQFKNHFLNGTCSMYSRDIFVCDVLGSVLLGFGFKITFVRFVSFRFISFSVCIFICLFFWCLVLVLVLSHPFNKIPFGICQ